MLYYWPISSITKREHSICMQILPPAPVFHGFLFETPSKQSLWKASEIKPTSSFIISVSDGWFQERAYDSISRHWNDLTKLKSQNLLLKSWNIYNPKLPWRAFKFIRTKLQRQLSSKAHIKYKFCTSLLLFWDQ